VVHFTALISQYLLTLLAVMQTYQSAIDQLERELQVERNQRVALQGELQRQQDLKTALQESQQREQETNRQLEVVLQELQTTQQQLVQTGKMAGLGQLMAGITHEINNPVNFLYGNINPASVYAQGLIQLIELYQRHYPKPPAALQSEIDALELEFLKTDFAKLLWSMRAGADRLKEIVLALGNFSHFDQTKLKKSDLHDGIDSTLMILQHRLREQPQRAAIEVIKDYGELPLVECYLGELNQAFMSILNNAIDALEERMKHDLAFIPQIWITTEVVKSHLSIVDNTEIQAPQFKARKVVIRIVDNGKGMLPHIQKRIFEPCFTTKPVGSHGLGLSISQQIIVEKHQGKLKCISQFDKGTEFVIELYPKIKSLTPKKTEELGVK
jgi:two-component system, NtrC family, sensor kinase